MNNDKTLVSGYLEGNIAIFDVEDTSKVTKISVDPIKDIPIIEVANATYSIFKPKNLDKDNLFYTTHSDGSIRCWEIDPNGSTNVVRLFPCNFKLFICRLL